MWEGEAQSWKVRDREMDKDCGERSEVSIGRIRTGGDKGRETNSEEKMRATER